VRWGDPKPLGRVAPFPLHSRGEASLSKAETGFYFARVSMADYRLSAQIIGRKQGRSSVAAAAYRAGVQLEDARTGLAHDYTRKQGVLHTEILTPEGTPDWMQDRAKLWNAVEAIERRKDAQLAREVQLSLPHELSFQQNSKLVRSFVQRHFVDHGMIADLAIHAPDKKGDQRNIHAHVMLTMRELTGDGFGKKNRDWNTNEQLEQWRAAWAKHQNDRFKELDIDQRVDHRSYAAQGLDKEPMQHLGTVANDMERKGKNSRIGDENRERQQRNTERAALAQQATDAARAVAQEKSRQEERVNAQKAALQSHLMHDQIEMDRRHSIQSANLDADLSRRNDERRLQLETEQQRLQQQLAADGWRKLMRDFLGRTRRDQEQLDIADKNLENLRMREAEERNNLQLKQTAEREAFQQAEQQRKAAYDLTLEQERQTAIKRAAQADKATPPPQPANDRVKPDWQRSAAPEQDNKSKQAAEFQKAAEGNVVLPSDPTIDELFDDIHAPSSQDKDRGFDV